MSVESLQLHRDKVYLDEGEAKNMIEKYDKNHDSVLNKDELIHAIHQNQHAQHQRPGHAEAKKDNVASKAKKIPDEKKGPSKMKLSRSQIREIFEEHDVDGDGYLDVSELTKAFSFLGSIIPLYKAHYGLAYADANGDGLIDEDELEKLIDYAERINNQKKRGF